MQQSFQPTPRSYSSDDITLPSPAYVSPQLYSIQQNHQPFRSLRARRAQHNLTLPLHLRRRTPMENDWMQSISDVEVRLYNLHICSTDNLIYIHRLNRTMVECLDSTERQSSTTTRTLPAQALPKPHKTHPCLEACTTPPKLLTWGLPRATMIQPGKLNRIGWTLAASPAQL